MICHSRESGNPEIMFGLDSAQAGNDIMPY